MGIIYARLYVEKFGHGSCVYSRLPKVGTYIRVVVKMAPFWLP